MQAHLAGYTRSVIHSGWISYRKFEEASHSLCSTHHLRELKFCEEIRGQIWADAMRVFLWEIYKAVQSVKKKAN